MTKNEMVSLMVEFNVAFCGSKPEQYTDHSKELLSMSKEDVQKWFEESKRMLLQKTEENREEIKRLHYVLDQKEKEMRELEDKLIAHKTNETTDPESGMPNDDLDSLGEVCKRLRIIRQSEIWDYVCVNQIDDNHFTLWVDKEEYKNNRAAYLFLGKLRDIGNSRAKKAWFEMDSLHIQF